ncbi:hypothetical protein D3Y59_06810 [Hymenobacter oligotrophus]|uniref:Copper chaperone n=1 Tax=Hymenobacter oligotrophus TaxID=2319843 RepID=A0A3B7QZE3_9BACT|nr:hypothetical protein [Hymenobacter oligotrophus]AYA36792.1 hypothetical protein D3Y59_06810 [Hymenobacter oligotrophus]
MPPDTPAPSPTQLIRYVLQIGNMPDNDSIGRVRELLAGLGLLVDQVGIGQAEVAVAQGTNPGPEGIRQALEGNGFRLEACTAQPG